ncbi:calycin-like domain-containing protein [Leyella stercorea]|uniref:calycin-like domain-containing protein n=1 Tax=Leyella stercorea TaxID=363265 RepID=UPI0024332164|nr:calycin-like domain-containing protein [Leyella stercorea]
MKKILSLLSMLMITVMAFATDYKGQLDYILTTRNGDFDGPSYAQGTLKIEDYAGGKYTVTATGCDLSSIDKDFGNWDEIICEGVEGTTDANGVTTIDVTPYAFRSSDNAQLKSAKLFVKFKGDKAYATFEGTYNPNYFANYKLKYTFGVDEGFDGGSTGGGETGGETAAAFEKVNYKADGNGFEWEINVNWDTQKIVMSIDPSTCTGNCEDVIGLGTNPKAWNYTLHLYRKPDGTLQGYFQNATSNNNTNPFDETNPIKVEVSKAKGFVVNDVVKIPASEMSALFALSTVKMGTGEGSNDNSRATYNYVKVVDKDWTEVPPVTVLTTKKFENIAYSNTWSQSGTTNVTFEEMSDESVKMKFAADGINISADALVKGTDEKGRTTYTGTAVNDAMTTLTYTIKAVVYTEGTEEKLYMTMEANSGVTFIIGEDPDYVAPVTYKNTLYVVENANLLVETADAEVVLLDKGDNKYDVTLPAFKAGEMTVPSITFEATKADNKLTASNVSVPDVYSGDAAVVTMDGTFESDGKLFASLTVKCGEWFDYEVGYGIKPFVATTKEYTAEWANVKVGDAEPVNFQNAKADYTEFAKDQYSLTFKDLTFGEKKIGDFTIKYVSVDGDGKLSTTASAGEWTRVEAGQDVASKGDMPAISGFEGIIGGTGVLKVKFTIAVGGTTGNVAVDFGHKYEAPEPPVAPDPVDVVEEGFKATGASWKKEGVAIDWDTQYIAAKLDLSTCKTSSSPENVLAVGTDITGWNDGPHYFFYYNKADKVLQYNYLHKANSSYNSGFANLSKAYIQLSDEVVTIEISKQGGLKINGESALVKYVNTAKDPSTNSTESWTTEDLPTVFSGLWALNTIDFGGCQGTTMSNATYKYVKVVPLGWTEPVTPPSVKEEKTFNEALYMQDQKVADATVVVKEMSDETINMSLKFGENEYTSTELTKGTDTKGRTTYTGKVSNGSQTYDVAGVVYEKDNVARLYMTLTTSITTVVVGENPDVVTPEVTEVSNKTYTNNLRILDGETTVVEEAEADVNIIKYSDESYKVTLKNVNMLNKTQDLVFVGKALIEEAPTEATEPLTIIAKSDAATTEFFGEEMSATFEITEVSAEEIKMGFVLNNTSLEYQGEFNYTEEETPEVYTNNLHIYDAAAPETDLFQADQAKVEFLATATGGFKLTLKDVTLNEKTQDLVFTGTLPTPQPGGQDPLAEEGETTPAEPAMVLNAIADEATATFLGTTSATAVFNVIMNDEAETENDAFALTFTITAGEKTLGGEFNYKKKTPDTPDPELFCKENYVADGEGFEWEIAVDWDTQKIVMSIDPSTCTGSCEDVIGLGAVPTAWDNTLHLYRTSADQMLQGYFNVPGGSNNNTDKFAETAPFLVEVSKAQGFVVNNEVKIAASAMSDLFTLSTVKMGTGEGANDKSRATYNYVKVVDKDWTAPKDPDTGINATTVAEGEVEFFTVNGVKLNKLQKGLNIVRTADGKVKKVLVK